VTSTASTDVGGLKVAAIADTPKVMTEGNWRLGAFDERATDGRVGPHDGGSDFEIEDIVPFGVETGLSTSEFSWAT
jgi:hypothetical protein